MDEFFDIYTRDGKYLGTKPKSVCHSENPGFYHKVAWIWIINSDNKILVQKRALCKKNNPGKWDMPSAGHIVAGETPIDGAIRETYEELGIKTSDIDYEFISEFIYDDTFEIANIYLIKLDLELNKFILKKDEVSEVKWLTYDEFKELFNSDSFVRFNDEYKNFVLNLFKNKFSYKKLSFNGKKIAIISDIHGNYEALDSIINRVKEEGIDDIICLGDTIGIGPSPKECLDLLIDNNITTVLGNHDLYYVRGTIIDDEMSDDEISHQGWIRSLLTEREKNYLVNSPLRIETNILGKKIYFQHFLFNSEKKDLYPFESLRILKDNQIINYVKELDCDVMFVGHQHIPFIVDEGNKKLIDVGSSGCVKDDTTFYTVLSFENDKIEIDKKFIKYDREKFEEVIKRVDYPRKDYYQKNFFGVK